MLLIRCFCIPRGFDEDWIRDVFPEGWRRVGGLRDIPSLSDIVRRRRMTATHESDVQVCEELPEPNDWLQEVATVLDRLVDAHRSEHFLKARDTLFSVAEPALQHARTVGPSVELDADEVGAMEALIAIDGSRPSLALRRGAVDLSDPTAGKWKPHLQAIEQVVSECAASVGRIEHRTVRDVKFGTGVLTDADAGVVLTAWHVLRNMKDVMAHTEAGGVIRFDDFPVIDFCGEVSATVCRRLKIVGGAAVGNADRYVDAAVLKVVPFTTEEASASGDTVSDLPSPASLRRDPTGHPGLAGTFCIIGYPGRAPAGSYVDATGSQIDWFSIVDRLLGGMYGVKRLAPGLVLSQPHPESDVLAERRFGHDATTLFGNSGAPVFAWNDRMQPVVGIHVGGAVLVRNFAEWVPGFAPRLAHAEDAVRAAFG